MKLEEAKSASFSYPTRLIFPAVLISEIFDYEISIRSYIVSNLVNNLAKFVSLDFLNACL